jgi:TolB-like protein/DNA-binding winged helix-turn-helix (wHTH) protein/Tfp pilus assembly protein PilF
MAAPDIHTGRYRFDAFTLDLDGGKLLGSGGEIRLRPKAFEVLRYLVVHHGRLVPREELLDAVWGQVVVTDDSLTQCLIEIRKALGPAGRRIVRTVHRRGYMLDVPVSSLADDAARQATAAPPDGPPPARPQPPPRWGAFAALLAALALFVLAVPYWGVGSRDVEAPVSAARPQLETLPNSIAVLPFTDLSPEQDQAYFADGISEEILSRLSGFGELKVIARTSSFAFKNSSYDVPRLTSLLGVEYLLDGSVRKDGQALRITAQLMDRSGLQVWNGAFDRDLSEIFAIQAEIAEAVATSIMPHIVPPPPDQRLPDIEAYQHYLVGREIVRQRLHRQMKAAIEQLDRAIAIDPDFADAYAERGVAWLLAVGDTLDDTGVAVEHAEKDLDTALRLAPGLARALAAQSLLLNYRDFSAWADGGGERILREALLSDPTLVDARAWLAKAVRIQEGRTAEAHRELEKAVPLDPLSPRVNFDLARYESYRGDFAAAEARLLRLMELPRPADIIYWGLWRLYVDSGRMAQAMAITQQYHRDDAGQGSASVGLPYSFVRDTYALVGAWERAEQWQDHFEREYPDNPLLRFDRASILVLQGRHQEALGLMRDTLAAHNLDVDALFFNFAMDLAYVLAVNGAYEESIRILEALDLPITVTEGIKAHQWLAWTHQQAGQSARAAELLGILDHQFMLLQAEGYLRSPETIALHALNALLSGDAPIAVERLQQAVDAGWRDYYRAMHDPRWAPLRENPRFVALMAVVKQDLDLQRAEIEQMNAMEPVGTLLK